MKSLYDTFMDMAHRHDAALARVRDDDNDLDMGYHIAMATALELLGDTPELRDVPEVRAICKRLYHNLPCFSH